MPEPFFVPDLVESLFGPSIPEVFGYEQARAALEFLSPELLEPSTVATIRAEFQSDPALAHVCLSGALQSPVADELRQALEEADFRPHPHAEYALHVAPRDAQSPSRLTRFVDWLATPLAASFHLRWLGVEQSALPDGRTHRIQVQTSRMLEGERFPLHMDTHAPGIVVVYNFSEADWRSSKGGQLYFPREDGSDYLAVPPLFNSVFMSYANGAVHGVREVRGSWVRYSITAFYLGDEPSDGERVAKDGLDPP
ncbi:MAG: 2OG-Fe(II) oxygenase [Deltaproteobacteria bacterium]|nr:2OG-Fe(II) oxygenase [Deltaproteobacteria bacterium]